MGSHPMSPGTMLGGRYRLDVLLTEHHGARFWRATDTVLSRSVAVHALASDDQRADAVLEAARRSVTVTDPHFLRVLDCDDDGSLTWVINEWGEGISLDRMLELRGPLPVPRAAWLVREVAEAITNAHAHGVHHGRLNPEAVLVTDAGSVKLIGFVTQGAFEGGRETDPTYGDLAPRERDVIDLAGILYAALTGKWAGASRSQVTPAPRENGHPLRPRQVRAGIPRSLDALCDRVLNKEASQHALPIETAQEIAAALADQVGDPAAAAPMDVGSFHAEPTQALRRLEAGLPRTGDPDATHAAPPPGRRDDTSPTLEPFEQPDDRPLFAAHERRVPAGAPAPPPPRPAHTSTSGGPGTGTGTGTGSGSGVFWPFPDEAGGFTGKEGRGWLRLAVIVAIVIAVLAGVFFAVNYVREQRPSADPSAGADVGTPVRIAAAADFDPEGDGAENPDGVGQAIDGDPQSGWRTSTYYDELELQKGGVGLVLDLGSEHDVRSVSLRFGTQPTTFEVYAAPAGTTARPTDLGGLQQVVDARTATGSSYTVRPATELRTRFLVVWLTKLPAVGEDFRGDVREVTVHE